MATNAIPRSTKKTDVENIIAQLVVDATGQLDATNPYLTGVRQSDGTYLWFPFGQIPADGVTGAITATPGTNHIEPVQGAAALPVRSRQLVLADTETFDGIPGGANVVGQLTGVTVDVQVGTADVTTAAGETATHEDIVLSWTPADGAGLVFTSAVAAGAGARTLVSWTEVGA